MPMPDETKTKVNKLCDNVIDWLAGIYGRWQDEKEYEDWASYVAVMRGTFEKEYKKLEMDGAYFVKASKKPFGFTFNYDGWQVHFYVSFSKAGWGAKKI